jgi:ATP-dependent Lon protease
MKKSASTALSYLQANARRYDIDPELFNKKNVHVHVPEGAVPKMVECRYNMLTSLTSAFTGRKVKPYTAMTGEITLRGTVLLWAALKKSLSR